MQPKAQLRQHRRERTQIGYLLQLWDQLLVREGVLFQEYEWQWVQQSPLVSGSEADVPGTLQRHYMVLY